MHAPPAGPAAVEAIVESSIGAALLLTIECDASGRTDRFGQPDPWIDRASTDEEVAAAVQHARDLPFGRLVELAVSAADLVGSYWGPARAVPVLEHRRGRLPIAEAIVTREDVGRWAEPAGVQQWWWTDGTWRLDGQLGPDFPELAVRWATHPRRALMTTSPLPDPQVWFRFEALVQGVWDMCFGAPARWLLGRDPSAPVYEINAPADWAALVATYPRDASATYGSTGSGFEVDTLNDANRDGLEELLDVPGQKLARRGRRRILTPDWTAVARDWAGVHLTWLGYVTTDGTIVDLDDGDVTVLRNWGCERTAWLRPVFTDLTPLPIEPRFFDRDSAPRAAADPAWAEEARWVTGFAFPSLPLSGWGHPRPL